MANRSQKKKQSPVAAKPVPNDQPRVVPIGISPRRQEAKQANILRLLIVLILAIVGTEGWMFHKGTLRYVPEQQAAAKATPTASNANSFADIVLPVSGNAIPQTDASVKPDQAKPAPQQNAASQAMPTAPQKAKSVNTELSNAKSQLPAASTETVSTDKQATKTTPKTTAVTATNYTTDLDNARAAATKGNYAAALAYYGRVLDSDRKNVAALTGKAYALERTGQYDAAAAVDSQLLKINPDNNVIYEHLIASLGQSSMPAAQVELEHIVSAAPDNPAAQAALANLLARRGFFQKAYPHLNRAAELAPQNLVYRLDLAVLYDRSGQSKEALTLYKQVIDAVDNNTDGKQLNLTTDAIRSRIEYLQSEITK